MAVGKACEVLEEKVIKQDLCTFCGACMGMCPYLLPFEGKAIVRDKCSLSAGRCLAFCPRISVDLKNLHRSMFGTSHRQTDIGHLKDIIIARSTDEEIVSVSQYGGVVTALSCMALDSGLVDSVVLTKSRDKCQPSGYIATTKEEVIDCAGSSYVVSPTIEAFNRAVRDDGRSRIAAVGTPCQVLAFANMKSSSLAAKNNMKKLNFTLGLFCTWALDYIGFSTYLKYKVSTGDITKVDIPPPPANTFEIYKKSRRISLPLPEVRRFIRNACTYCIDMTAEFADVSLGAAEGIEGWNTVIVRSQEGVKLVNEAIKKNLIETRKIPKENLRHLKEASLMKKKRALRNICQRTGSADDFSYLKDCPEDIKKLLDGWRM